MYQTTDITIIIAHKPINRSCFKSATVSFGRGTPSHVLPCVFNTHPAMILSTLWIDVLFPSYIHQLSKLLLTVLPITGLISAYSIISCLIFYSSFSKSAYTFATMLFASISQVISCSLRTAEKSFSLHHPRICSSPNSWLLLLV